MIKQLENVLYVKKIIVKVYKEKEIVRFFNHKVTRYNKF